MAVEFRTSFLGFNRDDVLDYIHKKDADMKIASAALKDKIKSLEAELSSIKGDLSEGESFFDDNAEISAPLLPYVKSAAKRGIVTGEFTNGKLLFRPDDIITKCEAGMIISKLVDTTNTEAMTVSDSDTLPVWARDEMCALAAMGIISCDGNVINGNAELTKESAAEYLYNMLRFV